MMSIDACPLCIVIHDDFQSKSICLSKHMFNKPNAFIVIPRMMNKNYFLSLLVKENILHKFCNKNLGLKL